MLMTPPPHRYYTSPEGYHAIMHWYDQVLATLPCNSLSLHTRYGETHVLTAGSSDAPPLVLLHGINVSALNWRAQIHRLAAHYYVIAPDVIGFAGRSTPIRLPYAGDGYAHWVRDILDGLNIQRATLAGSSGGGYFILKLAAIYPDSVAGLILINPCGLERYPLPQDLFRQQWVVRLVGAFGRRFLASRQGAYRLVRMSASPGIEPDPVIVEMSYLLVKYFRRYAPPGSLPAAELARITAPVLLLLSEHEPYFDIRMLQHAAEKKLSRADLTTIIVPNAGHDLHNDQADVVTEHMTRWLNQKQICAPA